MRWAAGRDRSQPDRGGSLKAPDRVIRLWPDDGVARTRGATSGLKFPRPRAIQEARDNTIFAHLEHRSEAAGDDGGGGAGAFETGKAGEVGGVVAEDGAEGEQAAVAVGGQGA